MADISKEIKDFREAVYGEDVRDSMISLAEKVNEEAENSTDKVAEYNEAEASRVQAETARVNAEKARVTAETGRVSAEKNRASAESTRADNEASRVDAEDDRVTAETARKTAEETRASSETNRKSAETKRTTAETERVNAEKSRVTAENERASAETERVNAENERVAAETNRRTNTAKAIEDCDEAAARANAAAEAAEGVVDGTGLVMSTEKGTANGVATLDENGKVPQAQIDGNNMPITFEQAAERANIQSGDSLAVAFGKLAKFCADLDDHAFSAPVNNLTGTDPSLPLASPQGKALDDKITNVDGKLPFINVADASDGSSFGKNFLGIGISDPNAEANKTAYFIADPNDRSDFTNVPPGLFVDGNWSVGVREVFRRTSSIIMVRITEMMPNTGKQYCRCYNGDRWYPTAGWSIITPD